MGGTVRRRSGPNAPFVRRLLAHLESVGFDEAPRWLGDDGAGRDIFGFLEGEVPSDCRAIVWEDGRLEDAASLLRRFHDATAGTEIAAEAEVVCHNDFGPWNLVWRDGHPVGIIDFDEARPGERLDDLGYAVWKHSNLGLVDIPATEQRRRMRLMTAAYGAPADASFLAAIERAQERMQRLIERAAAGDGRAAALDQHRRERAWLRTNASLLIAD